MPVYGHYRAVQWWVKDKPDAEQDEAFNALHDRYAHVMEKLVYDLRYARGRSPFRCQRLRTSN